jgi:hypothetical protein
VSGGDEGGFGRERQRRVGQRSGANDLDGRGRLARAAGVDDANGRVVTCDGLAELCRRKRRTYWQRPIGHPRAKTKRRGPSRRWDWQTLRRRC